MAEEASASDTSPPPAAPAAQSGPAPSAGPRPTPVDAPAVIADFTEGDDFDLITPEIGDSAARAYALAAQARERGEDLIAALSEAAEGKVGLAGQAGSREPGSAGGAYLDTLDTLRGKSAPVGALLDRAA